MNPLMIARAAKMASKVKKAHDATIAEGGHAEGDVYGGSSVHHKYTKRFIYLMLFTLFVLSLTILGLAVELNKAKFKLKHVGNKPCPNPVSNGGKGKLDMFSAGLIEESNEADASTDAISCTQPLLNSPFRNTVSLCSQHNRTKDSYNTNRTMGAGL